MLPALMSQMGMSTANILSGEPDRNDFSTHGDQLDSNNEQTAADGDDEVPGKNFYHGNKIELSSIDFMSV